MSKQPFDLCTNQMFGITETASAPKLISRILKAQLIHRPMLDTLIQFTHSPNTIAIPPETAATKYPGFHSEKEKEVEVYVRTLLKVPS